MLDLRGAELEARATIPASRISGTLETSVSSNRRRLPRCRTRASPTSQSGRGRRRTISAARSRSGSVLARTDALAVAITGGSAFPSGFEFTLNVRLRRGGDFDPFEADLLMHQGMYRHRRTSGAIAPEVLRFGIEFADGAKATNLGGPWPPRPDAEPASPVLVQHGGGGGNGRWDQEYWVWPLPPPGPLAFVCEWPHANVPLTRVATDADVIRSAAARAEKLWE